MGWIAAESRGLRLKPTEALRTWLPPSHQLLLLRLKFHALLIFQRQHRKKEMMLKAHRLKAGGWSFYIFPVQAEENACLCGRNMFQLY